ncbi:hypothetical protein [Tenacibaculum agarivorans]|uniref:hypothetical protein n=1 Tax=Tenacibaculum agarivorans TaxID=1908389 RepID=UPI00094BA4BF|nr:hypothetical protein [Tenacibaculum agarivorans]
MYDEKIPNKINVDANWDEIKKTIESVTDAMVNEGIIILIKPGELKGNGAGGGSKSVLKNLGNLNWKKRITIAPQEGYGTVTVKNGARFLNLYKIAITGFIFDSVSLQGCSHSALAWSKVTGWTALYGSPDIVTENTELVEIVMPDSKVQSGDTSDIYTAGGVITKLVIDGCYFAPNFFKYPFTGDKPHTDTMQFAQVGGGGEPFDILIRDTAMFASNNTALQTGGITGLTLENSYLVAGSTSLSRYPHLPGGSTEATTNAMNGSGGNFTAKNSVIIGGIAMNDKISKKIWDKVENTLVNRNYTSDLLTPKEGKFTVKQDLNENNSNMPPYPTDDYLNTIWSKK